MNFLTIFYIAVFKSTVNVTGITAISEETPMVEERSVETLMTGAMKEEDVAAPTLPNFQCLKHFQSELNKIQNLAKNSTIPILGSIVPARNGVIEVIFIMTHLPKQDYKRWYQKSWYCSSPAVMRGIDPRSQR
jgi:D-serine dehydratase